MFLTSQFYFYKGELLEHNIAIAEYRPDEMLAPGQYVKYENVLNQHWGVPIVFVFRNMPGYNRKRLIAQGLNFIVLDSQIHMPSFMMTLSNKKTAFTKPASPKTISPTAQTILLFYFYHYINDISYRQLQETLDMPYPTVCRAIETLKATGLCVVNGLRSKKIHFDEDKQRLLKRAMGMMRSPITKIIYSERMPDNAIKAGMSALAEYTMINEDEFKHTAIGIDDFCKLKNYSSEDQYLPVHIEIWSYDPKKFINNGIIDKISLFLSLRNNNDERVQHEINQMIDKLW